MKRVLRAGAWLCIAVLCACAQPELLRDGERVSYEAAADVDLALARQQVETGELVLARATLERFVDGLGRSRRVDEALYLLGDVYERLGEREHAAAAWRRLVEQRSDSPLAPDAAFRAAKLYRDLDRLETGRRLLQAAPVDSADTELRVRLHRLHADLARALGDYPDAVLALAYARRDISDIDRLREIDLELEELIESRLSEAELAALVEQLPRGPVYDRVNLLLASRALSRNDREAAQDALARLPTALRPADQATRDALVARIERGSGGVVETIGLAVPLSGSYAAFGESVLRGVVMALGLYDDPDARFRLLVRDTGEDPVRAERAVRELCEAGVSGIIGPLRSSVAAAAAPVAEQAAVPLLTLAKREDIAQLGDYVFRLGLSVSDEARALARFATEERGYRRFAILYPDDAYGRAFRGLFWDAVEERGATVVGSQAYAPDAVDWQDEIKKLVGMYYLTNDEERRVEQRNRLMKHADKNAEQLASPRFAGLPPFVDFDALFIPDDAPKAGLILPQLRFYDVRKVTYLGGSAWNDPALAQIAGSEANKAVFVDAFHPESARPKVIAFTQRFVASYGDPPDVLAAEGYDAGVLFRQIISSRGNLTRAELRQALLDVRDFDGVSGLTSFDEAGGTYKDVLFLTVHDGDIHALEPAP